MPVFRRVIGTLSLVVGLAAFIILVVTTHASFVIEPPYVIFGILFYAWFAISVVMLFGMIKDQHRFNFGFVSLMLFLGLFVVAQLTGGSGTPNPPTTDLLIGIFLFSWLITSFFEAVYFRLNPQEEKDLVTTANSRS